MNILITGIHGFVGGNLVVALKEKNKIYGLDIVTKNVEGVLGTYTWNELDLIPEVDVIIHLAGIAHDTKNQKEKKEYFDINVGLTQKIYDWFLNSDAKKIIVFSSVKAVADKVEGNFLTEDVAPNPLGPYGESKFASEIYVNNQKQKINNNEKLTYVLRPCMIHGPGNKGNFNLLYNFVRKGIPYPLGAFENKRSFTSIENIAFVIKQIIEKDITEGVYNVADDESLSTNELIELIANALNKSPRIWNWNKTLIQFISKIGTRLNLPFNQERLDKLTGNYVVSNKKLKNALGIEKMPFTCNQGFINTIKSFVE